jgi:hypothetical protein
LDASQEEWSIDSSAALDLIICINMIHISPWEAGLGVLRGARKYLKPGGVLFFYGPFTRHGQHISSSNEAFDAQLRARDPAWGIRDAEELGRIAADNGLELQRIVDMPSNNFSIILTKP